MARSRLSNVNITVQRGTFQDEPRVLMLGLGWFPATLGGLDRYYRSLFEQLPRARGVVIGPSDDAPGTLAVLARQDSPLPRRLLGYWLAARRAMAQTDVVDAHFALYAAAPILLGGRRRRPLVFHFHGPWAEEHLAAGGRSSLGFRTRRRLERAVLHRADAHVVLSSAFRRVLVERYGARPWDVRVWPPGVELDTFTPGDRDQARARLEIGPQSFLAVCVRRLVPRMGIEVLFDAWRQIAEDLPAGSTLMLVGEGPLREELAERAREEGLAGRVCLLGRVPDEELVDLYRAADVAVVPTLSVEGFGLVVLEAAACGTPSIVSNVGGLPEVTRPLDPSLLVSPGEPTALGARLLEAAGGQLPARERTRRYAEGFSWPAVAERHRDLYRELLQPEDPEGSSTPHQGGEDEQADSGKGRRLRVVYLDHIARLSGGEIALLRLLPHLQRVDAHVILGEEGPLAERLQESGISVEVLPIAPSARDLRKDTLGQGGASPAVALQTLVYVARLALRLRRLRPDIVHTNSLKAGVYGALAAKAAGVPVVWHVRDRIAEDYIPKAAVLVVRALIRHLASGVLANSEATLQTLSPRDLGRVHAVIPDSVEVSDHAATTDGSATTFGMLGRIAPWKGQDLFLRAFAASFPTGPERAVVVGTPLFGEESYENELHELAQSLGIAERVDFRGFREDIWPELASFDVLVHASVIPEPFGQVVIEGMAAGLAVLAADEGGPAAVIVDGHSGRLFRSRDAKSLVTAMGELAADPLLRERLGSAAREAARNYHPDRLAGELELVYDRVLRSG
jgi:glycosyltransferase involved in cell wall biosynthesis